MAHDAYPACARLCAAILRRVRDGTESSLAKLRAAVRGSEASCSPGDVGGTPMSTTITVQWTPPTRSRRSLVAPLAD